MDSTILVLVASGKNNLIEPPTRRGQKAIAGWLPSYYGFVAPLRSLSLSLKARSIKMAGWPVTHPVRHFNKNASDAKLLYARPKNVWSRQLQNIAFEKRICVYGVGLSANITNIILL